MDGNDVAKMLVGLGLGYGVACAFHRPLCSLAGGAGRALLFSGAERKVQRFLKPNGKGLAEDNQDLLRELLRECQGTALAKDWGLVGVDSFSAFDASVNLTEYKDYVEYIERMKEGEEDVLFPGRTKCFATSSGTTGRSKFIPFTLESLAIVQNGVGHGIGNVCLSQPGAREALSASPGGNLSTSVATRRLGKTSGGIPYGPLSTLNAEVLLGGNVVMEKIFGMVMSAMSVQPIKLLQEVEDYEAMLYINLLFALSERRLPTFTTAYAPTLLHLFQMMEANCRYLLEDLRSGSLTCDWVVVSLPAGLRESFDTELRCRFTKEEREKRAKELEDEFSCGFLSIANRIWPSLQYISCSISGPFAVYEEEIRQYTGDVRIMVSVYMASEGFLGASRGLSAKEYILSSRGAFFEFLPMAHLAEADRKHLVQATAVLVGEEYEVVLTTLAGFWRYRLGDVVRVVDKMDDGWPVVEVCYRVGGLLDIHGEKTSEEQVTQALQLTADELGVSVVNFTSKPLLSVSPAAYWIYVELNQDLSVPEKELSAVVDKYLRQINGVYAACRESGKLGTVEAQVVPAGTFDTFFTIIVDGGAAVGQAKVPHLITKEQHLAFFDAVTTK